MGHRLWMGLDFGDSALWGMVRLGEGRSKSGDPGQWSVLPGLKGGTYLDLCLQKNKEAIPYRLRV